MSSAFIPDIDSNTKSLTSCLEIIDSVQFFDNKQATEMKERAEKIQTLMGNIDELRKIMVEHQSSATNMENHDVFVDKVANCSGSAKKIAEAQSTLRRLKKPVTRPELDSDDEDVQEEEFNYVNKDPLTKGPITRPVKNKICGHVYDAKTILVYIKDLEKKKFLRQCPQSGCTNRRNLVMADMQDFPEFFSLCK
ncbi:unnamed protein product [Auanema sp. JU1783]|nr:unnamed protein product [Auanema sp. JU1783]